eukprot:PLAT7825.1.p1 GENE.PLAT7825.1~~PLAT7825.1.p1  ORF type:complete len:261 (+),score=122.81 PLAT7825.1:1-783(+)
MQWSEEWVVQGIAICFLASSPLLLALELMWDAGIPLGRYSRGGWGGFVPARAGWLLMELPNLVVSAVCVANARQDVFDSRVNQLLLALFVLHYIHRSLIYPLFMRGGHAMPAAVFVVALFYTTANSYMQAWTLTALQRYDEATLTEPCFLLGVLLFFAGAGINIHSDYTLLALRDARKPGGPRYSIPRGGFFRWVSGANQFGEIVEWAGFALAARSLPAVAFAAATFGFIGPRAVKHHAWYKKKFADYPQDRKAVIPFVW